MRYPGIEPGRPYRRRIYNPPRLHSGLVPQEKGPCEAVEREARQRPSSTARDSAHVAGCTWAGSPYLLESNQNLLGFGQARTPSTQRQGRPSRGRGPRPKRRCRLERSSWASWRTPTSLPIQLSKIAYLTAHDRRQDAPVADRPPIGDAGRERRRAHLGPYAAGQDRGRRKRVAGGRGLNDGCAGRSLPRSARRVGERKKATWGLPGWPLGWLMEVS